MYVIVLCNRPQEGNTYAKRAKLPRGRYRVATSASAIRGLRVAEVHELPSYAKRPDRHAIEAVLRYAKIGERKQVEMPELDLRVSPEDAFAEIDGDIELILADLDEALSGNTGRSARVIVEEHLDMAIAVSTWHRDAAVEALKLDGREDLLPEESDGEETGTPEPSEAPAPAPKPKKRAPAKKKTAAPKQPAPSEFF